MTLEIFNAGEIYNKPKGKINKPILKKRHVKVSVPARLNSMCFDVQTLTNPKSKFRYNAGELAFSVNLETYANLKIIPDGKKDIKITEKTKRKSLVKHAVKLMQKILNVEDSFIVEANNEPYFPHAGFGTSSSVITATCIAINEAYNQPLNNRQLTLLITQNHGEEIEGDENKLVHVQCNGGSPSVALYDGGMQVITGETNIILREKIPEEYTFIFGIPKMYKIHDAQCLMNIETKQFPSMSKSSKDYSKMIAWKVLHELFPAMIKKDMETIGEIIKYYRFETNSLKIDSRTWIGLYELMKDLIKLKGKDTPIVSISSCGPAIYILTKNPDHIKKLLKKRELKVFSTSPNNTGYRVHKDLK